MGHNEKSYGSRIFDSFGDMVQAQSRARKAMDGHASLPAGVKAAVSLRDLADVAPDLLIYFENSGLYPSVYDGPMGPDARYQDQERAMDALIHKRMEEVVADAGGRRAFEAAMNEEMLP